MGSKSLYGALGISQECLSYFGVLDEDGMEGIRKGSVGNVGLEPEWHESSFGYPSLYAGLFHVPRAVRALTMSCTSMISCRYSGSTPTTVQ